MMDLQKYIDRYHSKKELAFHLGKDDDLATVWARLQESRKAAAVQVPLRDQSGTCFWYVENRQVLSNLQEIDR